MRAERIAVAVLVASLVACAARVATPPPAGDRRPARFPDAPYRQSIAEGRPVFEVDTARSLVVIEVRRGGSLARLGHDHVVSSRDISGYVAPDDGRADLHVPLGTLVVDDPALRAQAGLDPGPSADDVAATRQNMLQRVLEVDRYPDALIAVRDLVPAPAARQVRATISLHGAAVPVDASVRVDTGSEQIVVAGTLEFDQSGFGIVPFAILGGAIAVQDRVRVGFRIHARRVHAPR